MKDLLGLVEAFDGGGKMKQCVACAEEIQAEAQLCKHCQTWQSVEGTPSKLNPSVEKFVTKKQGFSRLLVFILLGLSLIVGATLAVLYFQHQTNLDAQDRAQAAAEALERQKEAREAEERSVRLSFIPDLEASILEMVEEHIKLGKIEGEAISVSCTPVAGYSIENLSEVTTEFTCFAATEDNGDGTQSGYYYEAIMDWESGKYSYGLAD